MVWKNHWLAETEYWAVRFIRITVEGQMVELSRGPTARVGESHWYACV